MCYEDNLELNEKINDNVDLQRMIEDKPKAKKLVRICDEDNASITSYNTTDYVTRMKGDDS